MDQTQPIANCPNCNTKLNAGVFSTTKLKEEKFTSLINAYSTENREAYCEKCYSEPFEKAFKQWKNELAGINRTIPQLLDAVLIVTTPSPIHWDYSVLGMVTGQSTTGTGAFTEIKNSFADLLGGQAGTYNKKLQEGESLCQAQLRLKCLEMGGNAIIATDIDYAEVGGERGMIMVCMSGTAVNLKNAELLGESKADKLNKLRILLNRKTELSALYTPDGYEAIPI